MPDQEIENKVKQIIVDELGVDENEVTPNARFIDDLGGAEEKGPLPGPFSSDGDVG